MTATRHSRVSKSWPCPLESDGTLEYYYCTKMRDGTRCACSRGREPSSSSTCKALGMPGQSTYCVQSHHYTVELVPPSLMSHSEHAGCVVYPKVCLPDLLHYLLHLLGVDSTQPYRFRDREKYGPCCFPFFRFRLETSNRAIIMPLQTITTSGRRRFPRVMESPS